MNYGKMNREELEAAARGFGIEHPQAIPTVKELRSLVIAIADERPDVPDVPAGAPDEAPDGPGETGEADDATGTSEPEPELIPAGCVVVYGIGPAGRCSFFEQERRHPGGEVFVKSGQSAVAFPTTGLMRAVGRTLSLVEPR